MWPCWSSTATSVVTRIPLQDGSPLAPGAWSQSDGSTTIDNRGAYWLVTVASEQPLPQDFADIGFAPGEGISLTASRHTLFEIPIERIGGGLEAPDFSTQWMA